MVIKNKSVTDAINSGGSVALIKKKKASEEVLLTQLRLSKELAQEIDQCIKSNYKYRLPRSTWIMQAISEKIKRENE